MRVLFRTVASAGVIALVAGYVAPSPAQDAGGTAAASGPGGMQPLTQVWRPFPALFVPQSLLSSSDLKPGSQGVAVPPPFQAQLAASVKESWSDNIALTSTRQRHDEITSIDPELNLSARSDFTDLELNYTGGYDRYADNTVFDGFHHNGIGTFNTSLFDRTLLFNAQGSITEPNLNPNAAQAAGDRTSPVNRVRVLSYSGGPQLQGAFEDLAVGQVGVTHSESINQQISSVEAAEANPTAANTLGGTRQNQATADIRSGSAFSRLLWDASASASESRFSTGALDEQTYQLANEYKLTSDIGILAAGGYDYFHGVGINSKINGVFYDGGIHWSPSPRTDLRFGGGWRDDKPNIFGLLNEQIGAMTKLTVSHEVKVTSDALNTFDSLETLQRSSDGTGFVDPLTRLSASPGSSSFQLSNAVFRQSSTTAVLTRSDERDSLSFSVLVTSQNVLSSPNSNISSLTGAQLPQSSTVASSSLSWQHKLDRQLSVTFTGNIDDVVAASTPSGKTKRADASVDLAYQLGAYTDLDLQYAFSESLVPSGANTVSTFGSTTGRIREDIVFLTVKRKF